jgi:hypothetical protein
MRFLSNCGAPGRLTPEHSAAYAFVDEMIPHAASRADGYLWHGWALREAFLRGVEYARANPPIKTEGSDG